MQICKNCGNENKDGVIFCDTCGVALTVVSIGTRQLGGDAAGLAAGCEKLDEEHVVMIHIQDYDDPLMVKVPHKAILGRTGGETDKTVLLISASMMPKIKGFRVAMPCSRGKGIAFMSPIWAVPITPF